MRPLILIVDDRPDGIELTKFALSELDYEFRTESVSTGERALDFLTTTEQLPALILLDLKMPGMGGIETLRRIRADDRVKDIPVVIVTSSILENDVHDGREAGASGFIHKPIKIAEFSRELDPYIRCWICK